MFKTIRTGDADLDRVQQNVAAALAGDAAALVKFTYLTGVAKQAVVDSDEIVIADVTNGQADAFLPPAGVAKGRKIVFKAIASAGAFVFDVHAAGVNGVQQVIDDVASVTLTSGGKVTLVSDGKQWWSL